ncbi:hypothetical protein B0H14DRAFT_2564216 [Mycena olivaceomarginata]|nr:hypothetical protein B0H14DRAFT_2564216 [Mycena olivaceomarginata]
MLPNEPPVPPKGGEHANTASEKQKASKDARSKLKDEGKARDIAKRLDIPLKDVEQELGFATKYKQKRADSIWDARFGRKASKSTLIGGLENVFDLPTFIRTASETSGIEKSREKVKKNWLKAAHFQCVLSCARFCANRSAGKDITPGAAHPLYFNLRLIGAQSDARCLPNGVEAEGLLDGLYWTLHLYSGEHQQWYILRWANCTLADSADDPAVLNVPLP